MTVNYTTNLSLGQPVTGTESGTWGDDVNNAVTSYLDIAIAGGLAITVTTADVTLTLTQGTSSATNIGSTTAQYAILNVSGAMTAARNLIVPSSSRIYLINNNTTGGFALTVKGSATTGVTLVNGEKAHVFWNGSDYAKLSNAQGGAGTFSSITNTGLTSGRVVYSTTGGLETDSAGLTFDGTNFATTGTATAAKLIPTGTSVTGNGMYLPAANSVGISTAGTNAVYIDATQNVGIGTSSNATNVKLQVASPTNTAISSRGNAYIYTTEAAGIDKGAQLTLGGQWTGGEVPFASIAGRAEAAAGAVQGYMQFGTINTSGVLVERMRISSAGIVTMAAYGAGAATFSAAGVISSVSDETWKIKDGVPVDPDSMLKKLEPGYWYYNDEKKEIFGVDRQLGFYAQNVNAAIGPEAAPTPEEGKPWGYYDRSVLAVTVMSLQKALATIESLTARITALEST